MMNYLVFLWTAQTLTCKDIASFRFRNSKRSERVHTHARKAIFLCRGAVCAGEAVRLHLYVGSEKRCGRVRSPFQTEGLSSHHMLVAQTAVVSADTVALGSWQQTAKCVKYSCKSFGGFAPSALNRQRCSSRLLPKPKFSQANLVLMKVLSDVWLLKDRFQNKSTCTKMTPEVSVAHTVHKHHIMKI